MPVIRLKNVNKVRAKGGVYYYHRKTGARLPDDPASAAFLAAWQAEERKLAGIDAPPQPGTLGALMAAYRASPEYLGREPRTRADYRRVMDWLATVDDLPLHRLDSQAVIKLRDKAFALHKRRFANYVLAVLSLLCSWGRPRGYVPANPAATVAKIPRPRGMPQANRPWRPDELQAVLQAAPPPLRAAVALGAYAALREGDAIRLPWSAYDGSAIESRHRKTGQPVWIPAARDLRQVLAATPRSSPPRTPGGAEIAHALVVVGRKGGYTESGFRASFFKLLRALETEGRIGAGLTFHGLRHTAATALADAGCDTRDIMAVTGHTTEAMVRRYTDTADRKRRASAAITKLESAAKRTKRGRSLQNQPD